MICFIMQTSVSESEREKIFILFSAVFRLNSSVDDGGEGGSLGSFGILGNRLPFRLTLPFGGMFAFTNLPSIFLG